MPEVSVVIPVYKVEQYLEECLESVRAQTLRDIEIICVNDGSPDRCPQILDEYAAKDSRITVIHKENGGLSSARNAAYPLIRGNYTLFVDSDDYIDKTLCEKAVTIADREQAEMTLFFIHSPKMTSHSVENFLKIRLFPELDKCTLAYHMSAWSKLWRSSFLLDNQITFPEGLCCEDYVAHWKAITLNPKLALLPEKMYYYRVSPDSITQEPSRKSQWDRLKIFDIIKENLIETNNYDAEWKDTYLHHRLDTMFAAYKAVQPGDRKKMLQQIVSRLGDDERDFLKQSNGLRFYARAFYASIDGSIGDKLLFSLLSRIYVLKNGLKSVPGRRRWS